MPHDSRQKLAFRVVAVFGILLGRILTHVNGRPRRLPKRIYTGLLVQDLGDMTALYADGNSHVIVFDLCCGKVAIKGHLTLHVDSGGEKILSPPDELIRSLAEERVAD